MPLDTKSYQGNRSFIIKELASLGGVLDASKITADSDGDKTAKGGLPVAYNSSTKLIEPYVKGGVNGTGTCIGFLRNDVDVSDGKNKMISYFCMGIVSRPKIKLFSNYDAEIETHTKFIMYVDL